MKFSELAGYLEPLETTTGRNELVRILSELYRACSVDEIERITYLIPGRLAPSFAPVEIGLGERMLVTAIAAAFGAPKDEVSKLYRQVGNLGLTAQSLAPQGTRQVALRGQCAQAALGLHERSRQRSNEARRVRRAAW